MILFEKKMFKSNVFLVIILLVFSFNVEADTYYVSTGGDDGNAGTSPDAPWAHCPQMPGWTGSGTLEVGDTVCFNNAETWEVSSGESIIQAVGGVIYDGSTWGDKSRAKLKATGELDCSVINLMEDDKDVPTVIRGFEVDAGKTVTSGICINWPRSSGSMTGAVKRIENCIVHDVVSFSAADQYEYGIAVSSGYGGDRTVSNVEVLNCTVYNISRGGINIYSANDDPKSKIKNVLVRGCEIYDIGQDTNYAGSALPMKNHVSNVIFEYNYVHNPTRGIGIGIGSHNDDFRGPENAIIRYNIIKECTQMGIVFNVKGNVSADIYGNLIMNNTYQGIRFMDLADSVSIRIYNNTVFHNYFPGWSHEILVYARDSAIISLLEIKNNIFMADSGTIPFEDNEGITTDHSNNIYYRFGGGTLVQSGGTSYTADILESWETTALTGDPQLKDTSKHPTGFTGTLGIDLRPKPDGFNIKKSSIAKDKGVQLDEFYNNSINSVARPKDNGWDIGAYEYNGDIAIHPNKISASNYFNKFNIAITNKGIIFTFNCRKTGIASIIIYDLSGRLIAQLPVNLFIGKQQVLWNVCNNQGKTVGSGCYIIELKSTERIITLPFIYSH